jgi:endonuclease-3
VAVALSAQTTDVQVNKATLWLFQNVKHPAQMLELGLEKLENEIKTLNYYKTKARNIIKMAGDLIERFEGQVPCTLADLTSLAGVGLKTASVVLNTAFGQPIIAVDTHVHRVANRLEMVSTKKPEETAKIIHERIPGEFLQTAHHLLILHGRYVCKAQNPSCESCILQKHNLCNFKKC